MSFPKILFWLTAGGCFIVVTVASRYNPKNLKLVSKQSVQVRPSVVLPDDAEIAQSIVGVYHASVGMYYIPMKMEIFSDGTYLCGKTKGHWTFKSPRTIELRENQGGWVHVLSYQRLGSWSSGADGIQLWRKVNRSFMSK